MAPESATKRKKGNSVEKKVGEGDENVKMENNPDGTVGDKPDKGNQNEKDNPADEGHEDAGHRKKNGFNTRREHNEIPSNSLLRGRAAEHERSSGPPEILNHANKASEEGRSGPPEIRKNLVAP